MELLVAGCHGSETLRHRTSAFVLDDVLAIDAGALTGTLTLEQQCRINAVVISHCHMDHVRDLGGLIENRLQRRAAPLDLYGSKATLGALSKHYFNGVLWPDFRQPHGGCPCVFDQRTAR
jgi:cAMP phosphodiesterase